MIKSSLKLINYSQKQNSLKSNSLIELQIMQIFSQPIHLRVITSKHLKVKGVSQYFNSIHQLSNLPHNYQI